MKKMLTLMIMTLALIAFGVATAEAASTAPISVTVTITASGLSVSVLPTIWEIGSISEGTTPNTTLPNYFTAKNDRNDGGTENLTVTVGNSLPSDWTAATSAGANQFAMKVSTTGAAPFNLDASTGAAIATNLAAGGTQSFDLQLLAPTSTTNGGTPQTITATVTAS